MKETKD